MKEVLLVILLLGTLAGTAQNNSDSDVAASPGIQEKLSSLKTVAVVECKNAKKERAYFYSVDGKPVITQKAPEDVTKIALMPGLHALKLKFVAKGELPMTVDGFEELEFVKGHQYTVMFDYKPGRGEYPTSTYTARLRMWIVDNSDDSVLAEKIVNGKGDLVAGN